MEPDNHTIRLLQEIRDEVRRSSDRSELRDLAQQMVLLARGIKTALEHCGVESRLDSVEQRVDALEKLGGH